MILVQNLIRRFGSLTAVDGIDFEIGAGEVVGFLGPNGAGKSTTLRILAGFLPATRGRVVVAGHDVLTESMEVRRRIGYLPEAVPLYRDHRVEEMLLFQGRLHGLSRREARRRAGEVLERVGMGERSRSIIGRLSKGQRQRIGLAVALLPDPEVLLLDEPTSGLDPLQRIEVRKLLGELAADRTVLLSSHILPEVEAVAPRVIVLHRGRIVADGTNQELVEALGGRSHVRFEAVVGDPLEAQRLLLQLPGVRSVREEGTAGIHRGFRIDADGDVREDVGALAAQRGWAIRELSWQRPTLEQLFLRLALDLDPLEGEPGGEPVPVETPASPQESVQLELPVAGESVAPQAPGPAPTLNPFQPPPPPAT